MKKMHWIGILGSCALTISMYYGYEWYSSRHNQHHQNVYDASYFDFSKLQSKDNIVPFLVLGSGPASLSAALYGARAKIMTVVLRGNKPGGQLMGTSYIENWPGVGRIRGTEVMQDLKEQAAHFGAMLIDDSAQKIDFSEWPYRVETEEGRVLYALSIMIGTGSTPRQLHIPGEQEYWGKGVTTCAICDAPYHKGDDVIVIGGGDSAMEEAIELASYAKKVIILVRSSTAKASPSMLERALACSNVEIWYNKIPAEVKGNGEHITHVDIKDTVTNVVSPLEVQGLFLAIGHDPNTQLFKEHIACTATGHIQVQDRTQRTSLPGVVVAGDVSDERYKQAGVAAGDGIKAGLDAVWWLSELGYNASVQERLEPYFFTFKPDTKTITLGELESLQEFEDIIAHTTRTITILDFFTPYCPTCMHMIPVIEWALNKFPNKVECFKVDASMSFDLVKTFKVPDVPYLVFIKNGQVVGKIKKEMNRAELYTYLKGLMA